ncbi:MAG: prepilin-type N-terminal cleavage/methylation domain-containing protein [Deltaproteobacteria bacterium]|nr:prepilin-type N-terminal cleavage/methylation domain-containing protein [Deltaproteobacteria bacterium]
MTRRHQAATGGDTIGGFTMVEMLVVLVLVSLLGTLVIQGTGFFLGQYGAVKRIHRESSLAALRQHWFLSTVAAMVPSRLATRRFTGDDRSFEGVTLQPLAARAGQPVRIRWSIDSGRVLYTEGGAQPWTVQSRHDRTLGFQYAGSSGEWHERWPPPHRSGEHIPRMVRLRSADGRVLWLARFDLFPEPVPNYREEF